jgi:hypothetical protein
MENTQKQDTELPETIWHYTKMDVLEKIFLPKSNEKEYRKGEIKLRFTNSRFLNDPSEYLVLWKLLLENKENITKQYGCSETEFYETIKMTKEYIWHFYTFSMTCLKNSFAFWSKEYAGTDGVAIEFNTKKFGDEIDSLDLKMGKFDKVNYSESIEGIYENAISQYVDVGEICKAFGIPSDFKSKKIYALGQFLDFPPTYKLASWEHEKEIRVVLKDHDEEIRNLRDDHGDEEMCKEEELNAEVEFMGKRIAKSCYKYFDKCLVNSIMLGPDCGDEHIEVVKEYLAKNGYGNIEVTRSKAFDLRYKGVSL